MCVCVEGGGGFGRICLGHIHYYFHLELFRQIKMISRNLPSSSENVLFAVPGMGSGGASFHPGSMGGGGRFGSIMGGNKGSTGGNHAVSKPKEKPLKVS